MSKISIGDIFPTNEGGFVRVLHYGGCHDVLIEHMDNHRHTIITSASTLRRGKIKNPYRASVYGVGFIGVGPHKISKNNVMTNSYKIWKGMIRRVYCPIGNNVSYRNCSVASEWHNFQNFASWFYSEPNSEKEGFELDKDLKVPGNRVYSPSTCSFVPKRINLIVKNRPQSKYGLSTGVRKENGKYSVRVSINGKDTRLGLYASEKEASRAYIEAKRKYVREVAEEYRNCLDPEVYHNLINSWLLFKSGVCMELLQLD